MNGARRSVTDAERRTERAWERFVAGEPAGDDVRPQILRSWHRCRDEFAIDPSRDRAPLAKESEAHPCATTVAAELGAAAMSVAADVAAVGGVVAVGDGAGRILAAWGDDLAVSRGREQNLNPLFAWSERATGTTGIGTALEADGGVAVARAEHWCAAFHDWSCAAVAVRDPFTREPLGVIDVSVWNRTLSPCVLPWLTGAAAAVEARLGRLARLPRPAPTDARVVATRAGRQLVVPVASIRVVEVDCGIVWLNTQDGRVRTRARTLAAVELLLGDGFVRISRSRLVNVAHVRELVGGRNGGASIVLEGGEPRIGVARRRLPALRTALGL